MLNNSPSNENPVDVGSKHRKGTDTAHESRGRYMLDLTSSKMANRAQYKILLLAMKQTKLNCSASTNHHTSRITGYYKRAGIRDTTNVNNDEQ